MSPIAISRPAPAYPPAALAMKATGKVGLLVKVEADGHVSDVKDHHPATPALNAAAARRGASMEIPARPSRHGRRRHLDRRERRLSALK
jgi:hypothetical protein